MLTYILLRSVQSYPLDAFEEYELHKAIRWTQGVSLYGSSAEEVFPTAYPPLHYWVLGVWSRLFGQSFLAARAMSLLALGGIVAAGWWALRDAPARGVARMAFVVTLLALHVVTGKWFELCKSDSLLVLFLAVAIVTGNHRSWPEVLASSLGLWLASLTKHNAPLFLVPLCLAHTLNGRWRWAAAWGAIMCLVIGGSYCSLDWLSAGQFYHWVFAWTASHGIDLTSGMSRMLRAIATRSPVLFVILPASLALRWNCCWTWCLVTALGVAVLGMAKHGGLDNHLYPAAFVAATITGRLVGLLTTSIRSPQSAIRDSSAICHSSLFCTRSALRCSTRIPAWLQYWMPVAILLLVAVPGLPSRRDFRWLSRRGEEAREWVEAVRRLDGRVAVGHHLLLSRQAGAECFFSDLILQFPGLVVPASVRQLICSEQFDYLVLGPDPTTSPTPGWDDLIAAHYSPTGELDCPNRSGVLPRRLYVARRKSWNQDLQNP